MLQPAFTGSEECKLTSTRRFLSMGFLELADTKKECSVCSFEDVNLDANIHPFICLLNCLNNMNWTTNPFLLVALCSKLKGSCWGSKLLNALQIVWSWCQHPWISPDLKLSATGVWVHWNFVLWKKLDFNIKTLLEGCSYLKWSYYLISVITTLQTHSESWEWCIIVAVCFLSTFL